MTGQANKIETRLRLCGPGPLALALVMMACALLASVPAAAFKMSPIEVTLTPTGRGATGSVVLQNASQTPAAVELTAFHRTMTQDGADTLTPAQDSILIIPSQVILMPGNEQAVRLQWLGGRLKSEKAFRIIAEQLPIDLEDGQRDGGRMRLLVRYVASLYVRPDGTAPRLRVENAAISGAGQAAELHFEVTNRGDARVALGNLTLKATRRGKPVLTLTPDDIGDVSGSVVLAEHTRIFRIPLMGQNRPAPGDVTLALDYTDR